MDLREIFGSNVSIANTFEVPNTQNTVFLNSNLFQTQRHASNEILIERQEADGVNFISTETMPFAQSDWNSAPSKKWQAYNYQLIHSAITNDVSSKDLETQLRFGIFDRTDQAVAQLEAYSNRQLVMATNFVEDKLAEAVMSGVARSTYAGQKDLDFFTEFEQERTNFTLNVDDTFGVDIFEQLDDISRIMGTKLLGLETYRESMIVLCAGKAAKAFKRHKSIKDFVQFTMAFNNDANPLTQIAPNLNKARKWELNGVVFLDVGGLPQYEKYLSSKDSFVAVPRLIGASLFDLHVGQAVRHMESHALNDNGIGSYLTYDQRWGFPGVHTEVSILPVVQQPQAIVYGNVIGDI
ncbi:MULTISPECIES: hypothetical protein [Erwiniaceae]|uniref:Major capsid protein E n=2 Tax=Erwiniaceae TaxID=1903409 RepID=A0A4U3F7M5_9GAMM|nr:MULTISPECIES: hypothetical protein [Erwiniaceae]MBD8109375.1 hypothetical protein [Erwinia persicina]MBD8212532.1 hypothetical protein [Erwinia persicina]MCQ8226432.1 major capsid protein [Pantoea sp. MMK2]MCQ8238352.1 major capsid protein [Pantoea sp. MMK3]MDF7790519.1 hypothetical protein [Pantoea ananatis]